MPKIRFGVETETSAFRKVWMIWKEQIFVKFLQAGKKLWQDVSQLLLYWQVALMSGSRHRFRSFRILPVMETTITEDDTPLDSKPKVTTKTTSNTKTTRKKVKLKKAATKTYTKKLPTTNKKSTTTMKTTRNTTFILSEPYMNIRLAWERSSMLMQDTAKPTNILRTTETSTPGQLV